MTTSDLLAKRARLLVQIDQASRVIAPLWPLSTSIAVNPLWDLRNMTFDEANSYASNVLGINGYPSEEFFTRAVEEGRVTLDDLRSSLKSHSSPISNPGRGGAGSKVGASKAVRNLTERHDSMFATNLAVVTDTEVAKWCSAYLAGSLPSGSVGGFYGAWLDIIAFDPTVRRLVGKAGRDRLSRLPSHPEVAILECLERMGVSEEERVRELSRQLARMPGWAGHAKWRTRWAAKDQPGPALHLVDYLAVRLGYEAELLAFACTDDTTSLDEGPLTTTHDLGDRDKNSSTSPHREQLSISQLPMELQNDLSALAPTELPKVCLSAYEGHYRDLLLSNLDRPNVSSDVPPEVQAVFCIDVRSEGIRRHLEASGPYETFGFAGFFALPVRFTNWGASESVDLCPVLLRPTTEMVETPVASAVETAERNLMGRQAIAAAQDSFASSKKWGLSSFILAEASGFLAGPLATVRTLVPSAYQKARRRATQTLAPVTATMVEISPDGAGMSDDEQLLFAETALTTMGLTQNFAPVVMLCGHRSTTENNPYASSLDCGACGGNPGGASARMAAAILNRSTIRRQLGTRGIHISEETVFMAAEHDTATDRVIIYDSPVVPTKQLDILTRLRRNLDLASEKLAAERVKLLPGAHGKNPISELAKRSADWAQVQPEWGLARNAAFIVAPRSVTANIDLECRCFLHSYDQNVDPDGVALETILTAPMVVAHWINAQYYFSTVEPEIYSAGDKTAHNIVAGVGVVQGVGGDLKVGLPIQSLFYSDRAYHEPMRLLCVVQAPAALIDAVIARNPVLRELFDGQWVHLAARADEHGRWSLRRPGGGWTPWTNIDANRPEEANSYE